LSNDTDDETLTAELRDDVTSGSLNLNSDGSFTYTPIDDFSGTDTFTYIASDGELDSQEVTVTILVGEAPNEAPIANADQYATDFETTLEINSVDGVLSNDTDDETLTADLRDNVRNGTLVFNSNGSFRYIPNNDFSGTDSFTYVANDGELDSQEVTVTILVGEAPNEAPIANPDQYATDFETPLSVNATEGVLSNDTDDETLTAELRDDVTSGSLNLNSDGSFTYTPIDDFSGTDTFTYIASDGELDSQEVTVTILVGEAPNEAPIANADQYATDFETTLEINSVDGVLSNDTDDETLTADLRDNVRNGTLVFNSNGSFRYIPNNDFSGTDSFTYVANDGELDSQEVTVTILVGEAPNEAPIANPDQYSTAFETSLTINQANGVLANDIDTDPLTASLQENVSKGTLVFNPDGSFIYTPNDGFSGVDTFSYRASDGAVESDLVIVTITANPSTNIAPVGIADQYSTAFETSLAINTANGVLANDFDTDVLTASLQENVSNGTLVFNPDGSFIYTPNNGFSGVDTFSYRASDGTLESDLVSVTITVNPSTNIPPVGIADQYSTAFETSLTINQANGVLANDIDTDPLTASMQENVSKGTLFFNPDGSFIYTPNDGFSGTDTFTYMTSDGNLDSQEVTVTILVGEAPNAAPIANPDDYATDFETTLSVNAAEGVLSNDTDDETLTAELRDDVTSGYLNLNSDGSFTYTPNDGFSGNDTFTYIASDGNLDSQQEIVIITVLDEGEEPKPAFDCPMSNEFDLIPLDDNCEYDVPDYTSSIRNPQNFEDLRVLQFNDKQEDYVDVTLEVYDGATLIGECEFSVFNTDIIDPVILNCSDFGEQISINPGETYSLKNYKDLLEITECGNTTITQFPEAGTMITETTEVTLTVFDEAGNNDTCSFFVVVNGNESMLPTTNNDEYNVQENSVLLVEAPGVLENDSAPDGDPLRAILVEGPVNGSLTLNENGAFEYIPNVDFSGQDVFIYYATDGEGEAEASVTINVNPDNGTFNINCASIITRTLDEDNQVQIQIEELYTGDADGVSFSLSQSDFSCDDEGTNSVRLSYTKDGKEGFCDIVVIIKDETPPLLRLNDLSINLNTEATISIAFEDIDNGSGDNCDTNVSYTLSKTSFTCKNLGFNQVEVVAEDSSGNISSETITVNVTDENAVCDSPPVEGTEYIFIYPNPNAGSFKVATPTDVTIKRMEVFDHRGRFIGAKDYDTNVAEYAIDLGPLQEAVYVVKLFTSEGTEVKQFIFKY